MSLLAAQRRRLERRGDLFARTRRAASLARGSGRRRARGQLDLSHSVTGKARAPSSRPARASPMLHVPHKAFCKPKREAMAQPKPHKICKGLETAQALVSSESRYQENLNFCSFF